MAKFKVIGDGAADEFTVAVRFFKAFREAQLFCTFLNENGIRAVTAQAEDGSFVVLVTRFANLERVRALDEEYFANPGKREQIEQKLRRSGQLSSTMSVSMARFINLSLTSAIELICILCFIPIVLSFGRYEVISALAFYEVEQITEDLQLYRLLTPIFLHFGIFHIAFNLVMFDAFARPLEHYLGTLKLALIVLFLALLSNCLQFYFLPSTVFGGMSGVVYGLIAYTAMLSRRPDLQPLLRVPRWLLAVSVVFILLGFLFSGIANFCHLGGLLAGLILGAFDSRIPLETGRRM